MNHLDTDVLLASYFKLPKIRVASRRPYLILLACESQAMRHTGNDHPATLGNQTMQMYVFFPGFPGFPFQNLCIVLGWCHIMIPDSTARDGSIKRVFGSISFFFIFLPPKKFHLFQVHKVNFGHFFTNDSTEDATER